MENLPLVSVVVLTYHSADTVTETLDSIEKQDYPHIELIITDDGSKDHTLDVVKEWVAENGHRFVRVEIAETPVNTGVSGNLNRGLALARGQWIKHIAGDDLMLPDCISANIREAMSNRDVQAVFSRAQFFGDPEICQQYKDFGYGLFGLSARERYLMILQKNTIIAPTAFISRRYYDTSGTYDETIPHIEDWPFWIRMFKERCKISFINRETVKYRMSHSLSLGGGGGRKFQESLRLANAYAYACQMQENPVYRWYASLYKKQGEAYSLWRQLLLRLNFYYYYYRYLTVKRTKASEKLNWIFKHESNAGSLV
jgi:alpha-1,3-rhamnosyltransferase